MLSILLVDGNNLGHFLGYIDKAAGRYESARLLACLDGIARYLAAQGQTIRIALFLDDVSAAERLGGWHVYVAPTPDGDADAAILAYAQAHAGHPQILVSADQALCGDAAMWGVVCLTPQGFVSRYLVPARRAGFLDHVSGAGPDQRVSPSYVEVGEAPPPAREPSSISPDDQGEEDRRRQMAALERAEATLRGETLALPEVFKLDLTHWADAAELALYLAEHHLCPGHPDLTDPHEMIVAIREHCSRQPRYFTSGRVINRVFRLFLCRPEHTLSLDNLAHLAQTRRRKIRAAIKKHGAGLGISTAW
jgi:hypothetical protein